MISVHILRFDPHYVQDSPRTCSIHKTNTKY